MSQATSQPIPKEMHSLTAHLICAKALDAIEFYKRAFNAVELIKLIGPTGQLVHASLRIGDSMLMLAEENPAYGSLGPKSLKGSPVVVHLYLLNC